MDGAKELRTPMSTINPLVLTDGSEPADRINYRRIIGKLQYLGLTRPNITFPVNHLSQFMHKLTNCHWTAAKRLLKYLKHTMFHEIFIQKNIPSNYKLFLMWTGLQILDTRVSTTTFITFLGCNPIPWSARKQRAVSCSSKEAEFCALAAATSKTI